jgi:3,4-dihydroxy 2-butanone 4-phosphate synthase/GTP cyclohydrolase II
MNQTAIGSQTSGRLTEGLAAGLADLAAGRAVVLDPGPRSRRPATAVLAAQLLSTERIAALLRSTHAPLRVALSPRACDRLGLRDQVRSPRGPASSHRASDERYLKLVDARRDVTTGVSAADRARTIALLADPVTRPEDLVSPGHLLPVRAEVGEPTTAGRALALCELAGLPPCALLCPVLDEHGEVAHGAALARAVTVIGGRQVLETDVQDAIEAGVSAGYWWS